MTSKQETVKHILDAQLLELTRTNQHWLSFLQTAANNYKYSFTDQVLIYAQKPDATACADMAFWNQRMQRWINKNAKGIALVDTSGTHPRLHYVFDLSDTNARSGNTVRLWQAELQYHPALIETLEHRFGPLREKADLRQALLFVGSNLIAQNIPDVRDAFADLQDYGNINTLTDEELETAFRLAVQQSVQYMLLYRCGIDAPDLIYTNPLHPITFFNTHETICILGNTVSEIAQTGLREIERTVRSLERQNNTPNRTFANTRNIGYDEAVNKTTTEGRQNHGTDLHEERRRFDPELDILEPGVSAAGQVRDAAQDVPAGASQGAVQQDAAAGRALAASVGDRRAGTRDGGNDGRSDGKRRGVDGEDEIDRPDALGGTDEQLQERSGGDRPAGAGLQLSGHDFNAPSIIPYYYDPDEQNELLRTCSELNDHRIEIAAFFANHEDRKERGNYVKTFFSNTYVEQILESGQRVGYRAWDDVLNIWRGSYLTREKEV